MINENAKRFGLELEFPKYLSSYFNKRDWDSFVHNAAKDLILKFKVSALEHNYSWTIKEDSSAGIEITSPALFCNKTSFDLLERFLENLEKEIFQDKSLTYDDFESQENGYHVHLSLSNFLDKDHFNAFFRFFLLFENTIFSFFPLWRRKNHFTEKLKSVLSVDYPKNTSQLMNIDFSSDPRFSYHHCCLNENREHRTVELRHSNGTLNRKHLLGWLSFILLSVEVCNSPMEIPENFTEIDNIKFLMNLFLRHSYYNWKTDLLPIAFSWMRSSKL